MTVEEFLAQPLVARVAVQGLHGPTIRPVWFLFEDGVFWWLTGSYSNLGDSLSVDPRASIVIDTCDLTTGEVKAVTSTGQATLYPMNPDLAKRKLTKYLGTQVDTWPERFQNVFDDPTAKLVALKPARPPRLRDLSYSI